MQKLIRRIYEHHILNADLIEKLLLESNYLGDIDVNKSGIDGQRAIHLAVDLENIDAIKILLKHGAYVNALDDWSRTPFIHNKYNDVDIAKLLIKHGAALNWPCYLGLTPIMYAIHRRAYDVIKLLIEQCVEIYYCCRYGCSPPKWIDKCHHETAIKLAISFGDDKCYQLLTSYRAYIQLLYFTMVFPDLPTYIILWTVDWLDLREMTEYRKVEYIGGFKRSIEKIRSKKLIDL